MIKIILQTLGILSFSVFLFSKTNAQNVGINATGALPDASALLHVDVGTSTTKGLLVTGTSDASGVVPNLGAGSRLMFYPAKSAFRAGNVSQTQWDNSNTGQYSVAMGNGTIASGSSATALGSNTTANGINSTALGTFTFASATNSTAMGNNTTASGLNSTALGNNTIASATNSTAFGNITTAGGFSSTAFGNNTIASATNSTAFGNNTTASGGNSTAMGSNVSTNLRTGAFIIGDNSLVAPLTSSADNEMTMRFAGGYRVYSNLVGTSGVLLPANGNAWVSVSDVNRKENFEPLDGEDVLLKFSKIEFTSWNYKKQDPKIYRHYGIMAQDFYKAFGHDQFGTVGNDTTVNPIDMIGIDMTAIQALEKRTADLKNENESLKVSLGELQTKFAAQQKLIEQILNDKKTHK